MLYLRWLEIVRRFARQAAIHDGGRVLTFADLAAAVEAAPAATGPVIARSGSIAFFVEILRAWRDGQAVIPVEKDAVEPLLHRLPGAEIRLVKHTPGASGIPRGIFFTDHQIIADADQLVATMDLSTQIPNLAVVSLAHSYGFSSIVLPLLLHGVPIRLVAVPFPRVVEDALRQHSSMVVAAVPSMWRAWHRSGILRNAPVHLAISAGAPLSLILEQEVFADAGLKIHNFYGASECGGIAYDATLIPRESTRILGSPIRGIGLKTDDYLRIVVESEAVGSAYDETRDDDQLGDGIYRTRDLGFIDSTGNLHLTGTTGAAINVAGRKISPAKVEAAILSTGHAVSVRVFGIASIDPERFEEIAVEVELKPGTSLEAMKSAVTQKLQTWETPRHWRMIG